MAEKTLDLTPAAVEGKPAPEPLVVKFEVKDRPTVREQLAYWSLVGENVRRGSTFERYWEAGKTLITSWDCGLMPLDLDLDAADDPRQVEVIRAVGVAVAGHLRSLEGVPKN